MNLCSALYTSKSMKMIHKKILLEFLFFDTVIKEFRISFTIHPLNSTTNFMKFNEMKELSVS